MAVIWNPWAFPFLLLALGEAAVGAFVYLARPGRFQNRILALLLVSEGLAWMLVGFSFSVGDPGTFYASFATEQVAWVLVNVAYLAFLGTLATPWSRPLGTRAARWGLVSVTVLASVAFVAWPEVFWTGVEPGPISDYYATLSTWGTAFWLVTAGIATYALVVAVSLYRRSQPGTLARSQAKAYLAAFAMRDVSYAATVFIGVAISGSVAGRIGFIAQLIGYGSFALLLAYGILKTQLFDIDLKVRWTLEKSTVAAIFIAVFFLAGELAETFFGDVFGPYVGVLAAGVLVFFLAPLQRLADKIGDAAMPEVEDTEAYRQARKAEIYRAQLEELMSDDQVTVKERRALLRLQEDLGLDGDTANRLERNVLEEGM